MVPTTDIERETSLTIEEFYDALAPDYDVMTGFEKRFVQEKPFFRLIIEKYKIRVALDAGCGTGFHSLLLAQLGVQMTGVDVSPVMVREAQRHATDLSLPVHFVEARNEELRESFGPSFDAVFSLGNTSAHLLSDEALRATFESYYSILKPGGMLFLQNLNYDRILAEKKRVQSVKVIDGTTFVRLYDYTDELVSFNILTIGKEDGIVRQSMKTVQLLPLLSMDLIAVLRRSKFENVRLLGGIAMDNYDPLTSKDLVVIAEKRETD